MTDYFPRPVAHSNDNAPLTAIIYGYPGAGKTTLANSAANFGPTSKVLALSFEKGGLLAVPSNPNILRVDVGNDFENGLTAIETVEAYLAYLADPLAQGLPEWVPDMLRGVKTVVLDSVTELLTKTLESISFEEAKTDKRRTIDTTYLSDYSASTKSLKRILRYFKELPLNVLVTALAAPTYTGKGDSAVFAGIKPSLTEKLRESVMAYFDHVWYAYAESNEETGEQRFCLQTHTWGDFYGKTRGKYFAPALGTTLIDPSIEKIYTLLKRSETKQTLGADRNALTARPVPSKPTPPPPTVSTEQPTK